MISVNAFAKQIGISEAGVRKAIKSGRIVKGYDFEKKKIDPEIASQELGKNIHRSKNEKVIQLDKIKEKEIEIFKNNNALLTDEQENETEEIDNFDDKPTNANSLTEANRKKINLQSDKLLIELKELKKELVRKTDIASALYAMGVEIRTSLLSIPEKTIDNILASVDRTEAINILTEELSRSLNGLSSIHKRDLKKN